MTFSKDLVRGISKEWKNILLASDLKVELKKIIDVLYPVRKKMMPCASKVFNAFRYCPYPENERPLVVIVGQDPYHQPGVADGLAFSCETYQSSVRNIFKALHTSGYIGKDLPRSSNLLSWAKQGVLLLNTALTVEERKPKSHSELWRKYIGLLIAEIQKNIKHVVFLLWGKDAEGTIKLINDSNTIMTWGHPSGLNRVNATADNPKAFSNCDHFKEVNAIMEKHKQPLIDWNPYKIINVYLVAVGEDKSQYRSAMTVRIGKKSMTNSSKDVAGTPLKVCADHLQHAMSEEKNDRPPYYRIFTNVEYLATSNCGDLQFAKDMKNGGIEVTYCDTDADSPKHEWHENYKIWHELTALIKKFSK